EFYAKMDAANVDLKGFTEAFYFQQTGAHLAPVLDTLQYLEHETDCWFEITTLLIPGHNDSSAEIEAESRWIADHLGPDVPLHFTAFHPDYKMLDVPRTRAGDRAGLDVELQEVVAVRTFACGIRAACHRRVSIGMPNINHRACQACGQARRSGRKNWNHREHREHRGNSNSMNSSLCSLCSLWFDQQRNENRMAFRCKAAQCNRAGSTSGVETSRPTTVRA